MTKNDGSYLFEWHLSKSRTGSTWEYVSLCLFPRYRKWYQWFLISARTHHETDFQTTVFQIGPVLIIYGRGVYR